MYLVDRIYRRFTRYRNNKFLKRLKRCGKNVSVRQPACFEGMEHIEIDDNVSIAAFVHIWGYGGVKIGKRVMIASHTAISSITHDHRSKEMSKTVVAKPIIIEDDVWIGAHVVIVPGVTIKTGAVIGAGSVVLHDVEAYNIVAGVPARIIQQRTIDEN